MTSWDRMRNRVESMSDQDRRRWLLVGLPVLVAVTLLVAVSPWASGCSPKPQLAPGNRDRGVRSGAPRPNGNHIVRRMTS